MSHVWAIFVKDVEVLVHSLLSLNLKICILSVIIYVGVKEKRLFLGKFPLRNQFRKQGLINW